ncbi:hypothetical protein JJC04_06125 [Flavobacterium covae]|nr:hypothetical protein [Flavobacterium covae]QYS92144.1 hypothetical protein JJC04_06125 [Flavobacterium covae]
MSTELTNYLTEMHKAYDEALSNIRKQKEEDNTKKFLTLLLNNNEKVKNYITHFSIGTGLSDEDDNKKALIELNKKHVDFMNFVLSI